MGVLSLLVGAGGAIVALLPTALMEDCPARVAKGHVVGTLLRQVVRDREVGLLVRLLGVLEHYLQSLLLRKM